MPYAATKGAVETFTRGLATEVASEGIRVNAVAPGMIATEETPAEIQASVAAANPMHRMGLPAEIAETVAYVACLPASGYVTGTVITVSGPLDSPRTPRARRTVRRRLVSRRPTEAPSRALPSCR